MSDSNNSKVFPSTKFEALTMLYLQNQDLTGISPEKLLDNYEEILKSMEAHSKGDNPKGQSVSY